MKCKIRLEQIKPVSVKLQNCAKVVAYLREQTNKSYVVEPRVPRHVNRHV